MKAQANLDRTRPGSGASRCQITASGLPPQAVRILGIETSCDETAAAVVEAQPCAPGAVDPTAPDGHLPRLSICSNVIHSQTATHAAFGGVVPEVASREHIHQIAPVVERAVAPIGGLSAVDGIAVTRGPGLIGPLLVGLQFAKGLAQSLNKPWLGVHHLEGHLSAALLAPEPPSYPHVALVVSGGHTQLYHVAGFGRMSRLGGTRDDAAGEAFDKIAKVLGLGYPGGARIDAAAREPHGDPRAFDLPRGLPSTKNLDFSFSGLKTAACEVARQAQAVGSAENTAGLDSQLLADFCASVQEAIADILTKKAVAAALRVGAPGVVLAGGVAANSRLRELLQERCARVGLWAFAPERALCTDNGAMIAAAGALRLHYGEDTPWDASAHSRWPLHQLQPPPGLASNPVVTPAMPTQAA